MKKFLLGALAAFLGGCAATGAYRPVVFYTPIVIPPVLYTPIQTGLQTAPALAAPTSNAVWTGHQELTQTVTNQQAWRCAYNYNGRLFIRLYQGSCPSSIAVQ